MHDEHPDFDFLVLELCDTTLAKHVGELRGRLASAPAPPARGLAEEALRPGLRRMMRELVAGLAHVHCSGRESEGERTYHNDVHPGNVFLRRGPGAQGELVVKLADFGLSKSMDAEQSSMMLSARPGAQGWVAPEVCFDGRLRFGFARRLRRRWRGIVAMLGHAGFEYVYVALTFLCRTPALICRVAPCAVSAPRWMCSRPGWCCTLSRPSAGTRSRRNLGGWPSLQSAVCTLASNRRRHWTSFPTHRCFGR